MKNIEAYKVQVYEEMCKEARAPLDDMNETSVVLCCVRKGVDKPDDERLETREADFCKYREQFSRHYQFTEFLPDPDYISILTHHWCVRLQEAYWMGGDLRFVWENLKDLSRDEITLGDIQEEFDAI